MSAAHQLKKQWREAALDLGIEFEGPFSPTESDGKQHEFAG
jgi:hypothetical protein